MINPNLKITVIKNKYLADGLSYIGFRYYKSQKDGVTAYCFDETDKFLTALHSIINLKQELNIKY